jgi:hypothetical protein
MMIINEAAGAGGAGIDAPAVDPNNDRATKEPLPPVWGTRNA